ncbi:adhesion G protein-coupled receptor D2 [Nothobranchius furzeri]
MRKRAKRINNRIQSSETTEELYSINICFPANNTCLHRMYWSLFSSLNLLVCFRSFLAAYTVEARSEAYEESYYEYVPDLLQWKASEELCKQRSGALATVSNPTENQGLASFLKSLNISQPVWVAREILKPLTSETKGSSKSLILEFSGHSNRKYARLRHKFTSMDSVTVCTQLYFPPKCSGISTIFSYSIPSYINEFQLRANLERGKPVRLALLIHGNHGSYVEAFKHDESWHSVCVSWSQDGGHWALYANGDQVFVGEGLNSNDSIGPDGLFIIGQEQDSFGGSFKSAESLCGSITELHIWNRVLNFSEIRTMEKQCSPFSSGLVFKWSEAAMDIETSLTNLWRDSPCQEQLTMSEDFLESLWDGNSLQNKTITIEFFSMSNDDCSFFDPALERFGQKNCDSESQAVCQFKKEEPDEFSLPKSSFFRRLSEDPNTGLVMKELMANASWSTDLTLLQQLTHAVLHRIEADGPHLLTSDDILSLSQLIDGIAAGTSFAGTNSIEAMLSIATNYVNFANVMLEPDMAAQWFGLTEYGVSVGPFTIIKSIDHLTEALADTLVAEQRDFSLSTKNIVVYMKLQKLSQESCKQVFRPSQQHSLDELIIPDSELQRVHALGHQEVMFIHTHYTHLSKIMSGPDEPVLRQQDKGSSVLQGHLTSAVISATVRDAAKGLTAPVAVQYTLSSSHVAAYPKRVVPVCAFWNFSLMHTHTSSWSRDGCAVTLASSGVTSCLCNHTTNFAVLMNYLESKWSPEEELILTKLTFIGSGASLCALVVTLMLFTVLDIPKSDRTSIHKNLFGALICAQIILLCSGSAIHNKVACTLVAALLHLFFMAAFSWMLVEGLLLWSKVVAVNLNEDHHMKYYYLIGWGLPVLIVTITLASASGKYSADDYCWLSVQNGIIWGFVGPVIFIIMVNVLVLTRVVIITVSTAKRRSIMLASDTSPAEQACEQIRAAVKAVLVLLPILGLTWLCGVLVPLSIVMAYLFILLNSLQGLFIFLIYGVYNTEVRSTVNRIKERRKALNFSNCASSRPSSSVTNSRPASFPLGTSRSQEEETYPCANTPSLGKEDERSRGSVSTAGDPQMLIQSAEVAPLDKKRSPAVEVDILPSGCSLHVPMELEFTTSCFPRSPAPQKSPGLIDVD